MGKDDHEPESGVALLGNISWSDGTTNGNISYELTNLSDQNGSHKLYQEIEYNGKSITLYRTNYQMVPLVKWQIVACFLFFLVLGLNDQSSGSLMPYLTETYNISKVEVSRIFIVQCFSFGIGSLCTGTVYSILGVRGVIIGSGMLFILSYLILLLGPPNFYIYMAVYVPLGFAVAFIDAMGNVLIGNLEVHKNELLGVLHALYGVASCLAPPLAATISKHWRWYSYFIIPMVIALIATLLSLLAFKHETRAKYEYLCANDQSHNELESPNQDIELASVSKNVSISQFKIPIILSSVFFFIYIGGEISTGNWCLSYLLERKNSDRTAMAYVTMSYWGGLTVGRVVLGFVTARLFANEYRASLAYALLALALHLLFMFATMVDSHSTSYFVLLSFLLWISGIFVGPLFPNCTVVTLSLLPKSLHIRGIGISVAIGTIGGAAIPYITGIILERIGFQAFPVIVVVFILLFNLVWILYPLTISNKKVLM